MIRLPVELIGIAFMVVWAVLALGLVVIAGWRPVEIVGGMILAVAVVALIGAVRV